MARSALEGLIIRLYIEQATDEEVGELEGILKKAIDSDEVNLSYKFYAFHNKMFTTVNSAVIVKAILTMNAIIGVEVVGMVEDIENLDQEILKYQDLMTHIKNRDAEAAIQVLTLLIEGIMNRVLNND